MALLKEQKAEEYIRQVGISEENAASTRHDYMAGWDDAIDYLLTVVPQDTPFVIIEHITNAKTVVAIK